MGVEVASAPHTISETTLIKAGHRILFIAYAFYELDILRRDHDKDPDPLDELLKFVDEDLSESLLTLASLARAVDDERGTLGLTAEGFPDGVGTLAIKGKVIPLSPREACNKVIHAASLSIDLVYTNRNPIWDRWYRSQGHDITGKYKSPILLLEGSHFKDGSWSARLEVVPLVYALALSLNDWKWNTAGDSNGEKPC